MWKETERNELDSLEQTGTNEKESRQFGSSGNDIHTPERTPSIISISRATWKSFIWENGDRSVTMNGIPMMLQCFADSQDFQGQKGIHIRLSMVMDCTRSGWTICIAQAMKKPYPIAGIVQYIMRDNYPKRNPPNEIVFQLVKELRSHFTWFSPCFSLVNVQAHCLKITQNVAFEFWHVPPIFVLLIITCLVTLLDRKLQVLEITRCHI